VNLAFVGFLPPDSVNPEERNFVELLSGMFARTVVFQGIGVKGLDLKHLRSVPARLARRKVAFRGVSTAVLPVIPIRKGPLARLTAQLIRRRLASLTNGAFANWVLWTRFPSPELVAAIRGVPFGRIVYEAVDNYAAEPLYSRDERGRLEAAEAELCERAIVITASSGVARRLRHGRYGAHWLPIGHDARLQGNKARVPINVTRPRLAVVGSLDELADEKLLHELAIRQPEWQLMLVGPRVGAWGGSLLGLPNVHWLGPMRPDEARGIIADSDVALNPCILNDWTADALPVKIFDYLAEGKPIVSTPMQELAAFGDLIELGDPSDFGTAVARALAKDSAQLAERRRAAANRFTLQERARHAFELVTRNQAEVLAGRLA